MAKWSDDMLARLQPLEYNVFLYVLLFFKEVIPLRVGGGITHGSVAHFLCPTFLSPLQGTREGESTNRKYGK